MASAPWLKRVPPWRCGRVQHHISPRWHNRAFRRWDLSADPWTMCWRFRWHRGPHEPRSVGGTWHTQDAPKKLTKVPTDDVIGWRPGFVQDVGVPEPRRVTPEDSGQAGLTIPAPTTTETGELVERVRAGLVPVVQYGAASDRYDQAHEALSTLQSRIEELERERADLIEACNNERLEVIDLTDSLQEARGLLKRFAHIADGQEGRTTMQMQLHGFSPVKALQEVIDSSRTFLSSTKETE